MKKILLPLALALAHFFALGQVSAPVSMSPTARPAGVDEVPGAQWVFVKGANNRKFLTAILRPPGAGPFPVVVVLHGADGLTGLGGGYLKVAAELSRAGFLVLVGCWQAGKSGTGGNSLCADATPQAAWVADPGANSGKELVLAAKSLPYARADRIGLFGISRGGHAALWAAASGAGVQAVVVDAAAHQSGRVNPTPAPTFDIAGKVTVPVLLLHGTADVYVRVEESREYERVARAVKMPVTAVYFEGVGHVVSVEPQSRTKARKLAIDFFREKLQ